MTSFTSNSPWKCFKIVNQEGNDTGNCGKRNLHLRKFPIRFTYTLAELTPLHFWKWQFYPHFPLSFTASHPFLFTSSILFTRIIVNWLVQRAHVSHRVEKSEHHSFPCYLSLLPTLCFCLVAILTPAPPIWVTLQLGKVSNRYSQVVLTGGRQSKPRFSFIFIWFGRFLLDLKKNREILVSVKKIERDTASKILSRLKSFIGSWNKWNGIGLFTYNNSCFLSNKYVGHCCWSRNLFLNLLFMLKMHFNVKIQNETFFIWKNRIGLGCCKNLCGFLCRIQFRKLSKWTLKFLIKISTGVDLSKNLQMKYFFFLWSLITYSLPFLLDQININSFQKSWSLNHSNIVLVWWNESWVSWNMLNFLINS